MMLPKEVRYRQALNLFGKRNPGDFISKDELVSEMLKDIRNISMDELNNITKSTKNAYRNGMSKINSRFKKSSRIVSRNIKIKGKSNAR